MAIPNLIALLGLTGVVVAETKRYLAYVKNNEVEEEIEDLEVEQIK